MGAERRQSPRKRIRAAGFLRTCDGRPIGSCELKDISAGGAQLAHARPREVPEEFVLLLSRGGVVRRRCRVAWRAAERIGVRFVESEG
jgi:hypothetical protein